MSPIEIFVDRKFHAETDTGPSIINLPKPPGGEVTWFGDKASSGLIVTGEAQEGEFFELTMPGEVAPYEIPDELSAGIFPLAANTKKVKIDIRRK